MAFVPRQIIDAVRDQLAFARVGEIMVQNIDGHLGMGAAFPGEAAELPHQLADCVAAGRASHPRQAAADLPPR